MAVASETAAIILSEPHQPLAFKFPKRTFGKKSSVTRCFQPSWFKQWPFLHYDEALDVVFCHTCRVASQQKLIMALNADTAFVS